jgi:hypothetical protein
VCCSKISYCNTSLIFILYLVLRGSHYCDFLLHKRLTYRKGKWNHLVCGLFSLHEVVSLPVTGSHHHLGFRARTSEDNYEDCCI